MALVDNFFPNNYTKFNTFDYSNYLDDNTCYSNQNIPVIDRNLTNKVALSALNENNLSFDFVELPPHIQSILSSRFNNKYMGFNNNYTRFESDHVYNYIVNKMDSFNKLDFIELYIHRIISKVMFDEQIIELTEFFKRQFINLCFDKNHEIFKPNDNDVRKLNMYDYIFLTNNCKLVFGKNKDLLIISPLFISLITEQFGIILNPLDTNKEFFILSDSFNYISTKFCYGHYRFITSNNKVGLIGHINKMENEKEYYMIDYDKTLHYIHADKQKKFRKYLIRKINGDEHELVNKKNLLIRTTWNNQLQIEKCISVCTMEDKNTGLRFRGKYEDEKKDDKIVHKKLTQDDKVIYQKEGDQVLVDEINNKKVKDEIVIGWKLAATSNGEKRIIKLAVPVDAQIVKPIDTEYFHTKGKERCNKAIVMDIQLPDEQDEISVVPHEKQALSCVFTGSKPFEYNLGQEIVPDSFDPNENESCTHGIHFYRDRGSVFDIYVNRD